MGYFFSTSRYSFIEWRRPSGAVARQRLARGVNDLKSSSFRWFRPRLKKVEETENKDDDDDNIHNNDSNDDDNIHNNDNNGGDDEMQWRRRQQFNFRKSNSCHFDPKEIFLLQNLSESLR